MSHNDDLRAFLRSRRARLRPEEIGLPTEGGRRVKGLRREELAALAGVSVDYYVRLEQGRNLNPSDTVLDALARALRLDDAERAHLFDLARPPVKRRRAPRRPQRITPATYQLMETLDLAASPALLLGRRMDVLAINRTARALIGDLQALPARERNYARFVILDENARELHADWATIGRRRWRRCGSTRGGTRMIRTCPRWSASCPCTARTSGGGGRITRCSPGHPGRNGTGIRWWASWR